VTEPVAFYTIGDDAVFPGTVALLNSLRATGHDQELVVLDAGFTDAQLEALAPHCRLIGKPVQGVTHPTLYKPFPHVAGADGVVVLVDSDAIVTAPLDGVIEAAREGAICAFPDPDSGRVFDSWSEIFGLRAPLRHGQTYVSAHFVAFSTRRWPQLLPRYWQTCERVFDATLATKHEADHPVNGDQDALNALLMSELPPGALTLLPVEERAHAWESRSVKVVSRRTLECEREGRRQMLIHIGGGPLGTPKPWRPEARAAVRGDAYTSLVRRLVHRGDMALRIPASEPLPLWMRRGPRGAAALRGLAAVNAARSLGFWVQGARRALPAPVYGRARAYWRRLRSA
jgi:hypothetical protein